MIKIKYLWMLLLPLLFQNSFAQTKIDEYAKTHSDNESTRMDNFAIALNESPESRGLVIIHAGVNGEFIGNILQHIEGIKFYLSEQRGIDPKRIFFSVKKDGEPFFKELWLYPKDVSLPELNMPKLEITNPAAKFLYASFCAGCEPAVQSLSYDYVSVKSFAELLKEYPENKALIIIRTDSGKEINKQRSYQNALELAADFRKNLTENYKISSQKITIKIGKPAGQESPMTVDFYIVPDNKKPKRF